MCLWQSLRAIRRLLNWHGLQRSWALLIQPIIVMMRHRSAMQPMTRLSGATARSKRGFQTSNAQTAPVIWLVRRSPKALARSGTRYGCCLWAMPLTMTTCLNLTNASGNILVWRQMRRWHIPPSPKLMGCPCPCGMKTDGWCRRPRAVTAKQAKMSPPTHAPLPIFPM